jgi:hypothetical protein
LGGTRDHPAGGHHPEQEANSARNQLKTKRLNFDAGRPGVLHFKPPSALTKGLAENRPMSLPFEGIEKIDANGVARRRLCKRLPLILSWEF